MKTSNSGATLSDVTDPADTISGRSYTALMWNYGGTLVSISSQFIIGIILARVLGPEAFGIVAIGMLVISFGNLIVDFGFGAALIQATKITERDVGFVLLVQALLGLFLSLLVYFCAHGISIFFRRPDAQAVIATMSLLFVVQAFGQTASTILKRSLNFKKFQAINIISYLVGYLIIGIPCALHGQGAWSIVWAQLTQATLFSLLAFTSADLKFRVYLRPDNPGLFRYGGKVMGTNLCNSTISNLDAAVVGRVLGAINLGLYNRAMVLISTPINTVTSSLQGVLFSACSRRQDQPELIRKAYLGACGMVGIVALPVCMTVAAIPDAVILAVYGPKWAGAIPLLRPLSMSAGVGAMLSIIGPILSACNRVDLELRAQFITAVVFVPLLLIGSRYSVEAVAWTAFLISLLRWTLLLRSLATTLKVEIRVLLTPVVLPLGCASVTAAVTFYADRFAIEFAPMGRMVSDIFAAIGSIGLIFHLFGKQIMRGPHGSYLASNGKIPVKMKRWFGLNEY